jgi:hypothetical protein
LADSQIVFFVQNSTTFLEFLVFVNPQKISLAPTCLSNLAALYLAFQAGSVNAQTIIAARLAQCMYLAILSDLGNVYINLCHRIPKGARMLDTALLTVKSNLGWGLPYVPFTSAIHDMESHVRSLIQAGQPSLEIVPTEDEMLVEPYVKPSGVAFLKIGQVAVVKRMTATVEIRTGHKTVLKYLFRPLQNVTQALRER